MRWLSFLSCLSCVSCLARLAGLERAGSALALLVARVGGTQDAHHALAAHHLAILADLLY
jgi:hypothetical protein